MSNKERMVLNAVTDALGVTSKFFTISTGEILVAENDKDFNFSMTVGLRPNDVEFEDIGIKNAEEHFLQIDIDNDTGAIYLIQGEDSEFELAYGNIYSQLYWSAVSRAL